MPGGKHGNRAVYDDDLDWDEDDFDDFDEDEEADEDSHWYGHSAQAPNKEADKPTADGSSDDLLGQLIPGFNGLTPNSAVRAPSSGGPANPSQQPKGASGSALAHYLSGPPPLRPSGKAQKTGFGTLAKPTAQRVASVPATDPQGLQPFQFDRPSPDDVVARAQSQLGAGRSGSRESWLSELATSSPANGSPSQKAALQSTAETPNKRSAAPAVNAPPGNPKPWGRAERAKTPAVSRDKAASFPAPRPEAKKKAASPRKRWQSTLNVHTSQVDDQGWQKIPLHMEVEMLRQAAAGADGNSALHAEDKPRERTWKDSSEQKGMEGGEGRAPATITRRPLSEFKMEADLKRKCAEAAEAEAATSGGRMKLHLVVLGHVDAGKSTLMGRLLHELGAVSQKVVYKHQKEAAQIGKASFAWAWLLDERPQERARGVTIDVASAHFETPKHAVTLLDAPGHRDFVPNMIAGAAQADAALLLVDGSKGSFEAGFETATGVGAVGGGQTREHAQLARSLGVHQVAVVISKLDTCDYSQARFNEIKAQVLPFLKACGFKESSVQWLPAVGTQNENLTKPPTAPALAAWWRGPTLVDAIDSFKSAERHVDRPLRLPINDVFKGERGGQSVGGKLEAGAIKVGTCVKVMPSGEDGTIKSIQMNGKAVNLARAGDSADVTLTNIDASVLGSGAVICHPDFPVALVTRVEARVVVLDVAMPIVQGQQVMIHAHAASETGHISRLVAVVDPKTGEHSKKRPRVLTRGQSAVIEVTALRATCFEPYADCRSLGRIVLREGGQTLAVGIVTAVLE